MEGLSLSQRLRKMTDEAKAVIEADNVKVINAFVASNVEYCIKEAEKAATKGADSVSVYTTSRPYCAMNRGTVGAQLHEALIVAGFNTVHVRLSDSGRTFVVDLGW